VLVCANALLKMKAELNPTQSTVVPRNFMVPTHRLELILRIITRL
jgi:hypothetical protein